MELETIRAFFAWCSVINMALLLWWAMFLLFAHDWTYRMHSKWFKMSIEQFSTIQYAGIAIFKLGVFMFNLVPYFALRIIAWLSMNSPIWQWFASQIIDATLKRALLFSNRNQVAKKESYRR